MRTKYMEERFQKKLGISKEPDKSKMNLSQWYAQQLAGAPKTCQECGVPLAPSMSVNPTVVIAHILPKRKVGGCKSVALHPLNCVYLCWDHHSNMDNLGESYIKKMKVLPFLRDRVRRMWHDIAEGERHCVPKCLVPDEK